MSNRIRSAFKLGDSKKTAEFEVNEPLKKEDFSLSEVRKTCFCFLLNNVRNKY
jgi:hypothetical protein